MAYFGRKKNILEEAYFPDRYINRITDINSDFFKEEDIKGVIIDIDNTVIDAKKNVIDGLIEWKNELTENDIEVIILSNTVDRPKVATIANLLDVDYFIFGRKPNLGGFNKARKHLNLPAENMAVIGDQIFTDILGANKAGMLSVLVNPLQEQLDYFITKWRRPFEERVLAKYLKFIKETGDNPKKYGHVLKALEQRIENQKRGKDISHTTKLSKIVEKARLEEERKKEKSLGKKDFKESIKQTTNKEDKDSKDYLDNEHKKKH